MASKRKRLTLKEKIEVIDAAEKDKASLRTLSERFGVGKTQIGELLKNKKKIRNLWICNSNENAKTTKLMKINDIDSIVFDWFCAVRAKNIPVSGPLLQEKAIEVAESLGKINFKASNGWLEKFRVRHNVSFKSICGEAKSVNPEVVTDWIEKLESLCANFHPKDIYNLDETGLFFRVLPSKTMCLKNDKCVGGKASKERLTVMLCCNMVGDFETPLVIGKSKKPRCFKNMDPCKLGVQWEANRPAWMTSEIMAKWLTELDSKMSKKGRKILLFMDNVPSHTDKVKLKNVKLIFFPPNTTSVCQPLDQGIIRAFKVVYKKLLLRHTLSKTSTCPNNEETTKSVTVLDATCWISEAVKAISSNCVKKCFRKAGFLKITETQDENDDTENQINEEFSSLVESFSDETSVEEYITIDDALYTEESGLEIGNFMNVNEIEVSEDDIEEGTEADDSSDVLSNQDVVKYTEALQMYFLNNGDSDGFNIIHKLKMHVEKTVVVRKCEKQTMMTDFLK